MTSTSNFVPSENVSHAQDDGIFELNGAEPAWIWAHTCRSATCDCRSALVLATHVGQEFLLERGAVAVDALNSRSDGSTVAAAIDDLIAFHIDIDTAEVAPPTGDELFALAVHPRIADIATRIDGDLLDSIGQLWYRGKGLPDPDQKVLSATKIAIKGWRQGEVVAWNEVFTGARQDLFVLEDRLYEAVEMYCPAAECGCGEVVVHFASVTPRGAPSPGRIMVQLSGVTEIEPGKNGRDLLDRLWARFQQRHPNYLARFARRYPVIKHVGARIVGPAPARSSGVGRNEPCPCGSGKKYKKCCAAG